MYTDLNTSRTEKSFQNLQKAAERGGYGAERYEQLEFQRKVAQCYQVLHDPSWKVILCFIW
jgi:thymidylate kinase